MRNKVIWESPYGTLRIVAVYNLSEKRSIVVERNEGRDAMGAPGGWSKCQALCRDETLEIATALADHLPNA